MYIWGVLKLKVMDLKVLVSKKGTRVVRATDLYQALALPEQHYGTAVRKWLNDVYEFPDGLRGPIRMQDYAPRKGVNHSIIKDYYLSLALAKNIALRVSSKYKRKVALFLRAAEDAGRTLAFSKEQLTNLVELTKAMSMVSCQEASSSRHLHLYCKRNQGSAENWWHYRASILGYSVAGLRRRLRQEGVDADKLSQRDMLQMRDPLELIRIGVIDHFMAQDKDEQFARHMGDLAKYLAKEMELDVFDDQKGGNIFAPEVKPSLLSNLQQEEIRA